MSLTNNLDLHLHSTPEQKLLDLIFKWRKDLKEWRDEFKKFGSGDTIVWDEVLPLILASFGGKNCSKKCLMDEVRRYHDFIIAFDEIEDGLPNISKS